MGINVDNKDNSIIEDLKDNASVKSINQSNEKQHLQIARGNKANLPTLLDGELALVKDEGKVYVGNNNENIALAKDIEVQEASQNLNQLKTNYFGKEFDTPQERFLSEFEYIHMSGERGSFLPFSASKNHKIQESIEGKTRNMILEGETIQNLNNFSLSNTTKDEEGYYTSTVATYDYLSKEIDKLLLKPSTTYTIIVEVIENTLNVPISFRATNYWSNQVKICDNGQTGIFKFLNITKSTFEGAAPYIIWLAGGSPDTTTGGFKLRFMILEGDWTNKEMPTYFEGIKSIGQEGNKISILSHGKNLIPLDFINKITRTLNGVTITVEGDVITFNGTTTLATDYDILLRSILPIKISPTTQYKISATVISGNVTGRFVMQWLCNGSTRWVGFDDYVPSGLYEVNRIMLTAQEALVNFNNYSIKIQLEEGTSATEYKPYKENKKDILLPFSEGLKGIKDIKDEINSITNKAIQKIDKYTITGNENIILWSNYGYEWLEDRKIVSFAFKLPLAISTRNSSVICNNFRNAENNSDNIETTDHCYYTKTRETIHIYRANSSTTNMLGISILKSRIGVTKENWNDVISLIKKWLKENPTIVYYQLDNPIEYNLSQDINLNTYNDLTYITTEATSTFSAPVTISNTIARLNRENKTLEEENVKLKEETKNLTIENEYQQIDIDNNQLATVEIFEMIIGTMEVSNQKINNYKIGGITMVEVYVSLIIKGKKKIEDVPAIIRTQVETMLRELGVVE